MQSKKKWITLGIVLVVLALILGYCGHTMSGAGKKREEMQSQVGSMYYSIKRSLSNRRTDPQMQQTSEMSNRTAPAEGRADTQEGAKPDLQQQGGVMQRQSSRVDWWRLIEDFRVNSANSPKEHVGSLYTIRGNIYETGFYNYRGREYPGIVFEYMGMKAYMYFQDEEDDKISRLQPQEGVTVTGQCVGLDENKAVFFGCSFGY